MALKINTQLTSNDGGSVTAGTYILFTTYFPSMGLTYECRLNYYRNQDAFNNSFATYQPLNLANIYTISLSEQEFANLTPIEVHTDLKNLIEAVTGAGTVEIVLN